MSSAPHLPPIPHSSASVTHHRPRRTRTQLPQSPRTVACLAVQSGDQAARGHGEVRDEGEGRPTRMSLEHRVRDGVVGARPEGHVLLQPQNCGGGLSGTAYIDTGEGKCALSTLDHQYGSSRTDCRLSTAVPTPPQRCERLSTQPPRTQHAPRAAPCTNLENFGISRKHLRKRVRRGGHALSDRRDELRARERRRPERISSVTHPGVEAPRWSWSFTSSTA